MPAAQQRTPNIWVVRADGSEETQNCVNGGFTGIGWKETGDLTDVMDSTAVASRWLRVANRNDKVGTIRADVGNISRFLFDIQIGDWVITPEAERQWLRYGQVIGDYRYDAAVRDGCRYRHRRNVLWSRSRLDRDKLSSNLRGTLGSQLTVFSVRHRAEFFQRIGFSVRQR